MERLEAQAPDGRITGQRRERCWLFGLVRREIEIEKPDGTLVWRSCRGRDWIVAGMIAAHRTNQIEGRDPASPSRSEDGA